RCIGPGGVGVQSVRIVAAEPVTPPKDADSGGGGGPVTGWLLAPLAGLWLLRRTRIRHAR
ncbi:MAG: GlyGly-CTERM sorting domain-containing protein, partial [Haliea sp.]